MLRELVWRSLLAHMICASPRLWPAFFRASPVIRCWCFAVRNIARFVCAVIIHEINDAMEGAHNVGDDRIVNCTGGVGIATHVANLQAWRIFCCHCFTLLLR